MTLFLPTVDLTQQMRKKRKLSSKKVLILNELEKENIKIFFKVDKKIDICKKILCASRIKYSYLNNKYYLK